MKLFSTLIGLAVAGILGYLAEPSLRFQLTGMQLSAVEYAKSQNVVLRMPGGAPQIDVASLTKEQLPQRVLLNTDVKVSDTASGVTMTIPAGNRVMLVRIEHGNAVISPSDGPFAGLVPITDTDLLQQLAANPPATAVAPLTPLPVAPPVAPPIAFVAEPVTPPTGDSQEPAVKMPEPTPEPAPVPPPAGEPAPTVTGTSDAVTAMQESIKAAQIKEFKFDQVLGWKAEADEVVDGETYQTGVASYKAETIFGVKTIQAKALIKGGKVQRWIWPKSGMEIK